MSAAQTAEDVRDAVGVMVVIEDPALLPSADQARLDLSSLFDLGRSGEHGLEFPASGFVELER